MKKIIWMMGWMGVCVAGTSWAGDASVKAAASVAHETGTSVAGESDDFDSYVNSVSGEEDGGIKLAELDQDTSVVLGGEDNLGVSLKKGYKNSPLE